jgi:predicted thioredoxin/glutaredoxin
MGYLGMTVWKVSATDANSILDEKAIKILKKLEDHKNRLETEEYNRLLKKLAKSYPEFKSQIYSLKIRSDDDGNMKKPQSLKEVMRLSHAEQKQKIRQEFPKK